MYYNITEYVANHLIFWVCFKQIIPQNCSFFSGENDDDDDEP